MTEEFSEVVRAMLDDLKAMREDLKAAREIVRAMREDVQKMIVFSDSMEEKMLSVVNAIIKINREKVAGPPGG